MEFTLSVKKIKSAYRKRALRAHPDKGGTEEEFKKLNAATERVTIHVTIFGNLFPEFREDS